MAFLFKLNSLLKVDLNGIQVEALGSLNPRDLLPGNCPGRGMNFRRLSCRPPTQPAVGYDYLSAYMSLVISGLSTISSWPAYRLKRDQSAWPYNNDT